MSEKEYIDFKKEFEEFKKELENSEPVFDNDDLKFDDFDNLIGDNEFQSNSSDDSIFDNKFYDDFSSDEDFPNIQLETDDLVMNLIIRKDYSSIKDLNQRKEEFLKDLYDFIEEFGLVDESDKLMQYYDD